MENIRFFVVYYVACSECNEFSGVVEIKSKSYPSLSIIKQKFADLEENKNMNNLGVLPTNIIELSKQDYIDFFEIKE